MKPAQAYKKGIRPRDVRTISIADKFAGAWLVVVDNPSRDHGIQILCSGSLWTCCWWEMQLLKVHHPDVFVYTDDFKPPKRYEDFENLKMDKDV